MQPDISLLLAVLMENEDVPLKMPSEKIFDQVCTVLGVVGIEFKAKNNESIQIISLEGKRKQEEQHRMIKAHQQMLQQQLIDMQKLHHIEHLNLIKLVQEPEPEPTPSKLQYMEEIFGKWIE